MTNPYRALCAELAEELHEHTCLYEGHESELVARARALLAQPVAEGPTDEDLVEALRRLLIWPPRSTEAACEQDYTFARAVLAQWGRPTPQPPADGETGELVAWLLSTAVQASDANQPRAAGMLTWAAQLIGEQAETLERLASDNAGLTAAADSLRADNISLQDN